jgi:hypothetical protein
VDYLDLVSQKIETEQEDSQDESIYFVSDDRLKKISLELSRIAKNFTRLLEIEDIELRDLKDQSNYKSINQDSRMQQ